MYKAAGRSHTPCRYFHGVGQDLAPLQPQSPIRENPSEANTNEHLQLFLVVNFDEHLGARRRGCNVELMAQSNPFQHHHMN